MKCAAKSREKCKLSSCTSPKILFSLAVSALLLALFHPATRLVHTRQHSVAPQGREIPQEADSLDLRRPNMQFTAPNVSFNASHSTLHITAMPTYENMFGFVADLLANAAPTWGLRVTSSMKMDAKSVCTGDIWYADNNVKFTELNAAFDACKPRKPVLAVFLGENYLRRGFQHLDPSKPKSAASETFKRSSLWLDHVGIAPDFPGPTHAQKRIALPLWLVYHQYHRNASVLQGTPHRPVPVSSRKYPSSAALISRHGGTDPAGLRGAIMDSLIQAGIPVNSYGKYRNNKPLLGAAHSAKMDLLQQHAYVICPENSKAAGYVTEKLFDSLLAGSVPIWSGQSHPEPLIVRKTAYVFWNLQAPDHAADIALAQQALKGWEISPPKPVFLPNADWWGQTYALRVVLAMLQHTRKGSMQDLMATHMGASTDGVGVARYLLQRTAAAAAPPSTLLRAREHTSCTPLLTPPCSKYVFCFQEPTAAALGDINGGRGVLHCAKANDCPRTELPPSVCLDISVMTMLKHHLHKHSSLFAPVPIVHLALDALADFQAPQDGALVSCDASTSSLTLPALALAQVGGFGGLHPGPMAQCASAFDINPSGHFAAPGWWEAWASAGNDTQLARHAT